MGDKAILLRIDPDQQQIQVESMIDGATRTKNIDLETLCDCLLGSLKISDVTSGILPEGCIHLAFGEDYRDVVLLYPELYADITYYQKEYPDFPLPRLVFDFRVSDTGQIIKQRLGVMKDERPKMDTPMYHYPFSNIMENSRICIGSNELPHHPELRTLWTLPRHILAFPDNDDAYNITENRLGLGHKALMEHLAGKDPDYYYEKVLVPNGGTLRDFIERRL